RPASTRILRWWLTVGWESPTGAVRSQTHASLPSCEATIARSWTRAGSARALNARASSRAVSGSTAWVTAGPQQPATSAVGARGRSVVVMPPSSHRLTFFDTCPAMLASKVFNVWGVVMGETVRDELPVVVIGAGPVGLAAAAHLLERGLEPVVLEAGEGPGAAIASWGHVRLFSPWRYDLDAAARRLLDQAGWVEPDLDTLPTGGELVERYLAPLAATPQIASRLRTGTRVLAVARDGADKTRSLGRERRGYRVRTVDGDGVV